MICQVDTIYFLSETSSLREPPHAFGSELVKKSETALGRQVKLFFFFFFSITRIPSFSVLHSLVHASVLP